jgi:NAD+ synthase (glutamine-hydrolysing)
MKILLSQLNTTIGDIAGNTAKLLDTLSESVDQKPDIVVFSELFIQGYPPSDLLEQQWFIDDSVKAVERVCAESEKYPGMGILFGCAMPALEVYGKKLSNAALLVCDGKVAFRQNKSLLPMYDVFDERRYFEPAQTIDIFDFGGEQLGITICEDVWNDRRLFPECEYAIDPVSILAEKGASVLINLSGSPFHLGKEKLRSDLIRSHAYTHGLPFIYLNQVGGNDELIFDGHSMVVDQSGRLIASLEGFGEETLLVDLGRLSCTVKRTDFDGMNSLHSALCLGIKDYLQKSNFKKALVGLSGGVDSAVTCALAVAAIGPENVMGITMPSRYSSEGSIADSKKLADNLGVRFDTIPIEDVFESYLKTLTPHFDDKGPDITEENVQARIRGAILMAMSNKSGCLLLSTGNKSEMAVGYCTLYGDMNGGLSVISDLPKTMVYKLAAYINREKEIIPAATISKAPSAELRPDQKDQDSLPPYDILDAILDMLVEQGKSTAEITGAGFDAKTVSWVAAAVRKSEYKRRQAAPGLKVTPKAFGSGRRFPLATNYKC